MRCHVVINPKSGTALGMLPGDIRDQVRTVFGDGTQVDTPEVDHLEETLARTAGDPDVDTLIAGGGDGTISLAAQLALKHDKCLGVIPLGTMNLFARALGIPLDFADALEALKVAREGAVDVGEMNGHMFLNHVSLGFHPKVIRLRDKMPRSGRISKIMNGVNAYLRLTFGMKTSRLEISGDFDPFIIRAGLAVVTVNPVPEEAVHLPYREGQSYGELACYVSNHTNALQMNVLLARLATGFWEDSDHMEVRKAERIEINCRKRVHISLDGEVQLHEPPLTFSIRKQALKVLKPEIADAPR